MSLSMKVLLAGGGGGGGGSASSTGGGGGGAGGVRYVASHLITPKLYTVTVGAAVATNTQGNNTVFDTLTVLGGGRGGNYNQAGASGGCGGGGGSIIGSGAGAGSDYGYAGTTGYDGHGGGGGGAGQIAGAVNVPSGGGGGGGNGLEYDISGTDTYYGGGGSGGYGTRTGGLGGGGRGGEVGLPSRPGTNGLGGGGGGAYHTHGGGVGGGGGSGVVFLRYKTSDFTNYRVLITGTGNNSYADGDDTVIQFIVTGTLLIVVSWDAPMHRWKLDNNALDSAGTNNGATTDMTYLPLRVVGSHSGSFNGTSSRVVPTYFDLFQYTGFTLSAWVSAETLPAYSKTIFSQSASANYYSNISLLVTNARFLQYLVRKADGSYLYTVNSTATIDTTFHHLAISDNNGVVAGYIDGVPQAEFAGASYTRASLGTNTTTIGRKLGPMPTALGNLWFKGLLDDVRVYNIALNDSEIRKLYNSYFTSGMMMSTSI